MARIVHVKQTENGKDCTLACIAMLTGKTLEQVCGELGINVKNNIYLNRGTYLEDIFYILKVLDVEYVWQITTRLVRFRTYLVSVSSINNPQELHSVVIDYRRADIKVLDPQKGIKGKAYYDEFEQLPSWTDVIEILQ